jgi:phosphoglycolate phosphatase
MTTKSLEVIDTILFDFDGTLGNLNIDFAAIRGEINHLAAAYGLGEHPFAGYYVLEMIQALRELLKENGHPPSADFYREAMAQVAAAEVAAASRGELLPGTEEMLALLKKKGLKMGVVTRNCYDAISLVFPRLEEYFGKAVVTRERTEKFKPDPAHLFHALTLLGSFPERACMVGDHPMDMKSGRAVGAVTVGVLTGIGSREALREAGCDYLLGRAGEIPSLLGLID